MDYTREQQIADIRRAFSDHGGSVIVFDDEAETIRVTTPCGQYLLEIGSDDDAMVFYNLDDGDDTVTVQMTV